MVPLPIQFACGLAYTFLIIPPFLLIYSILLLYRGLIGIYLRCKHGFHIKFLRSTDIVAGVKEAGHKETITISLLHVFKGKPDIQMLKDRFKERLMNQKTPSGKHQYEKFGQCLREDMGYFFWVPSKRVNIDDHFIIHQGNPVNNLNELYQLYMQYANEPYPTDISPWQVIVVPLPKDFQGLSSEGPHFAVSVRLLHVLVDAMSFIRMFNKLIDDPTVDIIPFANSKRSLEQRLKCFLTTFALGPLLHIKEFVSKENHILSNKNLTGVNIGGCSKPISIDRLKRIKNALRCSFNDVMLTCWGGAFRRHFVAENATIPKEVIVHFTNQKHDFTKAEDCINNSTIVRVPIPTADKNPLDRLFACRRTAKTLQESPAAAYMYHVLVKILVPVLPNWINNLCGHIYSSTAICSNGFGFTKAHYVCGHELVLFMPILPPVLSCGLGLSFLSCQGSGLFGVTSDIAIMKSPEVVDRFIRFIEAELGELEHAVINS